MIRFYGFEYDALLNYPWKRFLYLQRQIDRIQAEEDLRQVQLLGMATSQDGYAAITERLSKQMGEIAVYEPGITMLNLDDDQLDPEFNREALHALKGRSPSKKRKSAVTEEN